MKNHNTSLLSMIKMTYEGEELQRQLEAWQRYPTLKTDCLIEARNKEGKRRAFVERLSADKGLFNTAKK